MRCMQYATEAVCAWDFHACGGKSSLIMAVASELRLPIYVMSPFGRWFRDVYHRMDTRHDGKGARNERGKFARWGIDMWILFQSFLSVHCRNWSSPKPHLLSVQVATHVLSWHSNLRTECRAKVGYTKGFQAMINSNHNNAFLAHTHRDNNTFKVVYDYTFAWWFPDARQDNITTLAFLDYDFTWAARRIQKLQTYGGKTLSRSLNCEQTNKS